MDMDTFLVIVYGGVAIFLLFNAAYHDQRLKRYVDKHYPEEGKIFRLYEWQMYPWSIGARTLRALINEQSENDPELARLARKTKRAIIYLIAWPMAFFLTTSFIL